MKSNTLITLLAIAVLATSGAVGCRKKPSRLTNIPGKTSPIGEETPGGPKLGDAGTVGGMGPTGSGVTGVPDQGFPPAGGDFSKYTERRERFATETVFFDFDKSNIKASELPKIRAVADAMKSTPGNAVKVEGHCDERGTEEYNRSLGERRALSVREQLVQFGLNPEMVPTISYGEDRPADPGHNEGAWARNRRGEFILLTPPERRSPARPGLRFPRRIGALQAPARRLALAGSQLNHETDVCWNDGRLGNRPGPRGDYPPLWCEEAARTGQGTGPGHQRIQESSPG